ncbi:MAG TPA: thiamine biosynthesis protein ThiF [Streptosporangiaceae bacterium]|nr:thiamine biosynthesis protein ThiF [Streptosporangiaceae bacterium]
MRPVLKAGLRAVWRDRDTLQIGVDPRRAVALSGMRGAGPVIALLDGSRDWDGVITAAREAGISVKTVHRVLGLLAGAGALADFPTRTLGGMAPATRGRLATELAAASLAYGDSDGGARTLARRRLAYVRVHGAGRIGSAIAGLLAAAGAGHVVSRDGGLARPQDLSPAGLGLPDLDLPRADGVARIIHRVAPDVRTTDRGERPDLAVLAGPGDPEVAMGLVRDRVPHLVVGGGEGVGVVGPLVLPGRSACLRCLNLARAERDPAWPLILAQLASPESGAGAGACDAVLAAAVAALATAQALTFVDTGRPVAAVSDATLELAVPDWQWRRRSWPPHPRCSCGAAHRNPQATGSTAGQAAPGPRASPQHRSMTDNWKCE